MISALFAGFIFGIGLVISGMVNPAKVIGFLDITGQWDASLAFVMGGAVLVTAIGYRVIFKRPTPSAGGLFHLPQTSTIDARLLVGATVFGIGWGLVGLCPGPAIATISIQPGSGLLFVAAMLIGMYLGRSLPTQLTLLQNSPNKENHTQPDQ